MKSIKWKRQINYPGVQKWIKEYIANESGWFTAADLRSHIFDKVGIEIPLHQIRNQLKLVHNLSYKKGSSRPVTIDTKRINIQKQLFCLKLSKELQNIELLVNLDESSISN